MLTADGFDDALIGVGERCGCPDLAVYDANKCLEILVESGMDSEEALDYFEFNTLGAWVGDSTPIFVWKKTISEINER